MDRHASSQLPLAGPGHIDSAGASTTTRRNGQGQRRSGDTVRSEHQEVLDGIDLEAGLPRVPMPESFEIERPRSPRIRGAMRRCGRWATSGCQTVGRCYTRSCAPDGALVHASRYVPTAAALIAATGLWFAWQNYQTLENARASKLLIDLRPLLLRAHDEIIVSLNSIRGALIGAGYNVTGPAAANSTQLNML